MIEPYFHHGHKIPKSQNQRRRVHHCDSLGVEFYIQELEFTKKKSLLSEYHFFLAVCLKINIIGWVALTGGPNFPQISEQKKQEIPKIFQLTTSRKYSIFTFYLCV